MKGFFTMVAAAAIAVAAIQPATAQIKAVKSAEEKVCGFGGESAKDVMHGYVCLRDSLYVLRIYLEGSTLDSSAWDDGVFVELPLGRDADECLASVDALDAMLDFEGRDGGAYAVGTADGGECRIEGMPAQLTSSAHPTRWLRVSQGDGSTRFASVTRGELRKLRRDLSKALQAK